jgi:hypothetical protein
VTLAASLTLAVLLAVVVNPGVAAAQGAIHPNPTRPHPGFKPHQLSFETPTDGVARAEYRSAPFYAIVLTSARRCSVTEEERLAVQALFPSNKVFATRFDCADEPEENVTYTNVNPRVGFIAVHAGDTLLQADEFLARVKATGRFPGANIRRMQAVLVYP